MKVNLFARYVLNYVVVAMLAGCGGSQPPVRAPGAMAQTSALVTHADRGKSWMAPEAQSKDLLYLSGDGGSYVYAYSYPEGGLEGTIDTPGWGLCSDAKGDVFVTDYPISKIFKYAHGGTKVLHTFDDGPDDPVACSVDPTTGNLAVAAAQGPHAEVTIFKGVNRGTSTYTDAAVNGFAFCGYDGSGDLFVDGIDSNNRFVLVELPKGGNALTKISLDQYITGAGGSVQWDGAHLAIGDLQAGLIYEFEIKKHHGKEVSYTLLEGANDVSAFLLDGESVIGLDPEGNETLVWAYPVGGSPIRTISGISGEGITLSVRK
jgi:hypothetical protein